MDKEEIEEQSIELENVLGDFLKTKSIESAIKITEAYLKGHIVVGGRKNVNKEAIRIILANNTMQQQYIEQLENKVKVLQKGNNSLLESRKKWKERYYKEKNKLRIIEENNISKDRIKEIIKKNLKTITIDEKVCFVFGFEECQRIVKEIMKLCSNNIF